MNSVRTDSGGDADQIIHKHVLSNESQDILSCLCIFLCNVVEWYCFSNILYR